MNDTDIAILSLLISVLALAGSGVIYFITRRRENHQNLLQPISLYRGMEMHMAIRRLWDFHRQHGDSALVEMYIKTMIAENKMMDSLPVTDRTEYQLFTLHYQRRLVSSFWRGLAVLLKNGLIPKTTTFEWWSADDVEIVSRIIIPIEAGLCTHLNVDPLDPKTEPLYYIANLKHRFYGKGKATDRSGAQVS